MLAMLNHEIYTCSLGGGVLGTPRLPDINSKPVLNPSYTTISVGLK